MPTVKVSFKIENGNEVSISFDPEPVDLTNEKGDVEIDWELDSSIPQAKFHQGVTIHQPGGAKFNDKGQSGANRHHKWQRVGGPDGNTYKYTVSLMGQVGGHVMKFKVDPTIRN